MARLVFMGTPDYAVPVLDVLVKSEHEIVGVYTRQDQPAGRGKQLQASPVKRLAQANGLAIYQPKSLRPADVQAELGQLSPDAIVVAAYGLILPPQVLAIPPRGGINAHASLLPRHRGAAPIPAAILAGDAETGITLMQMEAGLDTGPILAQRAIPISNEDTTGSLTLKLASLAASLMAEELPRILSGEITPQPQDDSRATLFRTIPKQAGLIDWTTPAAELARRVRAFNPWPGAYAFWKETQIKIHRARAAMDHSPADPGRVVELKEGIGVVTGEGILILEEIQLAGRKAMSIQEFVRGQREFVGSKLVGEK